MGLQAQEYRDKADSISLRPKPLTQTPLFSPPWNPVLILPTLDASETKEQRAARINQETFERMMTSVRYNLSWFQPPVHQFLSGPYSFQPGTVPVMRS